MKEIWIISLLGDHYASDQNKLTNCMFTESIYLTEQLVRALKGTKIFPCRRINIWCKSEVQHKTYICDGICEMEVSYDKNFFSLQEDKRQLYLIELLKSSMLKFCQTYDVDFALIGEILDSMKGKKYFDNAFKKRRKRLNGLTAQLCLSQNMKSADFYIEISSPKIGKHKLDFFSTLPGCCQYSYHIGNLFWIDENTVGLNYSDIENLSNVLSEEETAYIKKAFEQPNIYHVPYEYNGYSGEISIFEPYGDLMFHYEYIKTLDVTRYRKLYNDLKK